MIGTANLSAWFPEGASTHAAGVDGAFYGIYVAAVCALILVAGLAAIFVRTFMRKEGDPEQVAAGGVKKRFLAVWVLGAVLLAGFAFTSGLPAFVDQNVAPYGAYEVGVTARQGAWDFTYPNGHVADTLRVPVGQPVHLTLTSEDVTQSLSVPALRVQQAILPGRTTEAWFEATTAGNFPLSTNSFSAATHDSFVTAMKSLSQEDFAAWLATVEDIFIGRTLAEVGELLYTKQGCAVCHSLDGTKLVGPSFKNVYGFEFLTTTGETVLVDDAYVKESILTPNVSVIDGYQPVMTPYAGILGDREIEAITAFLKTQSERGDVGADPATETDAGTEQEEN